MAAAGHAFPGLQAPPAPRAGAAEEGVADLDTGLLAAFPAEEHPHPGHAERVPHAHLLGHWQADHPRDQASAAARLV